MDKRLIKISKYLAKVLRHNPGRIGLTLDAQGWAKIDDIIRLSNHMMTREEIDAVVSQNDKQRYSISDDGEAIRANQGHSIAVDLELDPQAPPEILFHGTARMNLESILRDGLLPMSRHHVHLSPDYETAIKVGTRHGKPAVLTVYAGNMHDAGFDFYCAVNGVWLTKQVAPEFIEATGLDNQL